MRVPEPSFLSHNVNIPRWRSGSAGPLVRRRVGALGKGRADGITSRAESDRVNHLPTSESPTSPVVRVTAIRRAQWAILVPKVEGFNFLYVLQAS